MDNVSEICSPSFSEWPQILHQNIAWADSFNVLPEVRSALRGLILETATSYTAGLTGESLSVPSADSPLLLTGHQPRVYHPGILVKNRLLESFAQSQQAVGINLIIDTDTGDGGTFYFPRMNNDELSLGVASFAASLSPPMYLSQRVATIGQLDAVQKEVSQSLLALGFTHELEVFEQVCALYKQHSDESIVAANTLVRKKFIDTRRVLELPISQVVCNPIVLDIWCHFIERSFDFFEKYNVVLGAFRKAHKIKNLANPFPDLKKIKNTLELPFWVVDQESGQRAPLFVEEKGKFIELYQNQESWLKVEKESLGKALEEQSDKTFLAPRAMVITTMFRLFAGDFFVHGLGGSKYDLCTDEFIKAFFDIEPPEFVSASANEYLLRSERERYLSAKELFASKREMYFHPRKFADSGLFSDQDINRIENYSAKKLQCISALKEKKAQGESVADITQEIKSLEREIGAIVDHAIATKLGSTIEISSEHQAAIECREYPYFFFV